MVNLRRACTYDVHPRGNDLYITITASEPAPANAANADTAAARQRAEAAERAAAAAEGRKSELEAQAQAQVARNQDLGREAAAAEARRKEVLARLAEEEQRLSALKDARAEEERRARKQTDATKAEADANRRADAARIEADTAKARSVAARGELERLQATRVAEETRIAELQRRAAQGGQAERDELAKLRQQAALEQARLQSLKQEADRMATQRVAELKKIDATQAEARRAAEKKAAALEEARVIADRRASDAAAARLAEERRAQAELEVASHKQAAAEASQRLAKTEAQRNEAEQAAIRARAQAQADEARIAKLQTEAVRVAKDADIARKQVEAARMEMQKLSEAQTRERARIESSKVEAQRLAEQRQLEIERAANASALASGERSKIEAAERETKRLAEVRQRESARLDAVRHAAEEAAQVRADELKKIEDARTVQRATVAAHERELVLISERRDRELRALAEARAGEEAKIVAARDQLSRAKSELSALESQRDSQRAKQKAEVDKSRAELDALVSQRAKQKAEADKSRAELDALVSQRAKQKAEADQSRAELDALVSQRAKQKAEADQSRAELDALVSQRAKQKAEADQSRTEMDALASQRAKQKAEADKSRAELDALDAQREQQKLAASKSKAELDALASQRAQQKLEADKVRAELDARRAEQEALDHKIADARAELARAQAKLKAPAEKPPVVVLTPPMSTRSKERARSGQSAMAEVRDVRFADDAGAHRVVIEMSGDIDWHTVPSQRGELTLSLKGASLPQRLQRTLDTSAYKGPVRAVSTYADPNDPSAVQVVVSVDSTKKGGEPRVTKDGDKLVWEFPREPQASSISPVRVSGYGASVPLQVSAGTTNLPRPSSGNARRSYNGRRIDLDFTNYDIHNMLRLISDVGQVNIVTSDDVKGTVTIRMRDVPWDQALDIILRSKSLGMQREGNLIRVAPLSQLEKEMEAELARAKASIELKPLATRLIKVNYATGQSMMPRVQELLSSRGKVSADERTNTLIVSDVASNIALAEDLVRNLDSPTPQVMIEARIVEATQSFTRQVGIQWGGNTFNSAATGNPTGLSFPSTVGVAGAASDGTGIAGLQGAAATNPNYVVNLPTPTGSGSGGGLGITLGSLSGAYNINLRLTALEATGQVRIVSSPKISTLDNVEASVETGTSLPISVVSAAGTNTVFVDAILNLTVKPHVTNEGSVIMTIQVKRNEPDFSHVSQFGNPAILKRQAKTEILVRDGDTAVMGGIYTRNASISYQKLPWIADVPIIGWLFKNRSEEDDRSELLIFITPRIVNRQVVVAR
jgi:type IV pilus assembly protein PilQ